MSTIPDDNYQKILVPDQVITNYNAFTSSLSDSVETVDSKDFIFKQSNWPIDLASSTISLTVNLSQFSLEADRYK